MVFVDEQPGQCGCGGVFGTQPAGGAECGGTTRAGTDCRGDSIICRTAQTVSFVNMFLTDDRLYKFII